MAAIIRKLDPQRRLVIPKETLDLAGFKAGDLLEIWSDTTPFGEPCLIMVRFRSGCILCGDSHNQKQYITITPEKVICTKCAVTLSKLLDEALEGVYNDYNTIEPE